MGQICPILRGLVSEFDKRTDLLRTNYVAWFLKLGKEATSVPYDVAKLT